MTTRRTGFDKEDWRKDGADDGRQTPRHGSAAATEAEAEAEFRELVGAQLSQWDERIQPPMPHLAAFEQLVSRHKEELSRRLWRDLLLLWLLGIFIIGGLLLMLRWNIVVFACLQAAALAGALLYLFVHSRRNRSVKRKWTA